MAIKGTLLILSLFAMPNELSYRKAGQSGFRCRKNCTDRDELFESLDRVRKAAYVLDRSVVNLCRIRNFYVE